MMTDKYEQWLADRRAVNPKGKTSVTAGQLKRLIAQTKGGMSVAQAANNVGMNAATANRWLAEMPESLR